MKKRFLSLALVGTLTATSLLFTACGCGNKGGSDSKGGDEHTLTATCWDENFNKPALEAAAEAYKAVDPDFKLEINMVGASSDVEEALTTAGSSGDTSALTDIYLCQDRYYQNYVTNYPDLFVSLDDTDINWDDFSPAKIAYSTVDGSHYGAPVDNGVCVAAYRTDLLEEAGYTIDDLTGVTWDEFDEIGKAVFAKTGKYLLCMDGDGNDLPYIMLQAEGKSQWKDNTTADIENNADLKKCIEMLDKLQKDNVLIYGTDWSGYTDQCIGGDQVAGVINGNWILPTIKGVEANSGKWAVTTLPTFSGEEGYATNGGSSLFVCSACENQDLAKDFLAYTFGGGDGATATYDAALKNGGVISTWAPAGESDVYNENDEYFGTEALYAKIVEFGTHVQPVQESDFHYSLRGYIRDAMTAIADGTSVDEALKTAQTQIDQEIAGATN